MIMVSYNLLWEPWIPAVDKGGKMIKTGIMGLMKDARQLQEVSDPSPPVQFGIYRLLIAFTLDVLAPKNVNELGKLLSRKEGFDMSVLDAYAGKWESRFDLFDPAHPFYQAAPDPALDKTIEPISRLMQHLPAGSNTTLFHHGTWDNNAYSFEQCARGLVTIPPFMTMGGAGKSPSINGAPPMYALVKGDDLFETILLNVCTSSKAVQLTGDEPPAWRSDRAVIKEKVSRFSLLQGLTWQPRRVRLIPGEGGICTYTGERKEALVREIYFDPGFQASGEWADPQVAYRIDDKGRTPIRPYEDREVWRDIGPIVLLQKDDYESEKGKVHFERPAVVQQYLEMSEKRLFKRNSEVPIEVYCLRTDLKAKLFEWSMETLPVPQEVSTMKGAGFQVQNAIDSAEIVGRNIRWAIKKAYPREGNGNKSALGTIVRSALYSYWDELRREFYDLFMTGLVSQATGKNTDPEAPQKLINQWKEIVERCGYKCVRKAIDSLDANAEELRRQVEAIESYRNIVRAQLYPEKRKVSKARKNSKVKA
jgi:CRISPR system Cascade subunit CasA